MISIDTNILFPLVVQGHPEHAKALAFAESHQFSSEVALSEFVLLGLYNLLRNPAVMAQPLAASEAVDVCEAFRQHPFWQILGFPPESRPFHDAFWPRLRTADFARRRSFDWRLALTLLQHGVTEFATVNLKDFEGFGFERVWNPIDLAPWPPRTVRLTLARLTAWPFDCSQRKRMRGFASWQS